MGRVQEAEKRIIDILTSLIFGILSLVFYPFIILLIKIGDRGPVFFINKRVGQGRKIFKHIKFRSMRVDADSRWPEKGDRRITKIGSFLRKTRMDELPQLWNVLRGDMSLVGPRPERPPAQGTHHHHHLRVTPLQ